ncbi:MAG: 23S rRNA (adenine(2503)-C(2))-methyltransferase RlmN [Kiritimatiellales bacterium]
MKLKPSIHGLLFNELEEFCFSQGLPKFRAKQIWDWLYVKRVSSFDEMQNLSAPFRARLAEHFVFQTLEKLEIKGSPGETQKLLLKLTDGELIEAVLIPARTRRTVCLSTQVGCKMACAFCASGQCGFRRNLTAGEIVEQVLLAAELYGERPTNIVYMGVGEPFDNYDETLKSVHILNHPDGLGIGARKITISTSGVIPGIERLAEEGLQVELSVSLHAPEDELRSKLMPVNKRWPVEQLMDACAAYTEKTKRIITFEYTLIKDTNDSPECARELVRRLRRFPSRVNLIPLSPVEEFDGERSTPEAIRQFFQTLEKAGINVTLRDSKGSALKAACGQLRARRI